MKAKAIALSFLVFSCGGGNAADKGANNPTTSGEGPPATAEEIKAATKPCGENDKVHKFDLHDDKADEAFAPCSGEGGHDYSGLIKVESVDNGVHITIDARDDEVTLLGPDVKQRDAVIVYPKGKDKVGVEVPLMKTKTGYHGDKIVFWDQIEKLTDEGTKIDVAIFDHDKSSGKNAEELHLSVVVSTGMSCEKAMDTIGQTIDMGKKGGGGKELSNNEIQGPLNNLNVNACGLASSAHADICAAIKNGKAVGVTVGVNPTNNKVAACIDRLTRKLAWPSSSKLDVAKTQF